MHALVALVFILLLPFIINIGKLIFRFPKFGIFLFKTVAIAIFLVGFAVGPWFFIAWIIAGVVWQLGVEWEIIDEMGIDYKKDKEKSFRQKLGYDN